MAPRSSAQNRALREATRTRLLDAALRVFSEQGYGAASVRSIAAEAGVALGLLYRHFEGKQDVLRALFERSMEDVRESFAAAGGVAGGTPEAPPLARLIQAGCAIVRRNLDFWKLSYGVRMQAGVLRDLGPEFGAWTGQILAMLEAHFRAAGAARPAVEAALFFAAFDGMCQHFAMDPHRYPLDTIAEALIAKLASPLPGRPGKAGSHGRTQRRPRKRHP